MGKMASIHKIIDGIADQIYLIAFIVVIKRARAGAQGRGFAVVANQVRIFASSTQEK